MDTTEERPIGHVIHNGCGEIRFRQAGHPSNDPEPPWRPVYLHVPMAMALDKDLAADPSVETQICTACGRYQAVGDLGQRASRLMFHWYNCPGVVSMTFHPNGIVSGVTFNRQP